LQLISSKVGQTKSKNFFSIVNFTSLLFRPEEHERGVARFKPKITIWENFGGYYNGRCWYMLWPIDLFYGRLVFFPCFGMLYEDKSGNPGVSSLSGHLLPVILTQLPWI
jgi:hypothetical protein